ncbi:hypothetical protein [Aminiphilus sp.]|uniref:hypothetical protein n=1 Tax=Aminiphilus sp. TaxID=1872488 RepID=UPI00261DC156|nr:hypothetical protein [Aminiphilus sp.]
MTNPTTRRRRRTKAEEKITALKAQLAAAERSAREEARRERTRGMILLAAGIETAIGTDLAAEARARLISADRVVRSGRSTAAERAAARDMIRSTIVVIADIILRRAYPPQDQAQDQDPRAVPAPSARDAGAS